MQQYRHFGQGESGVFTRSNTIDNMVGTSNVGPCVVLFLHNSATRNCFAIHFDDRIHFAAIRQQISRYIGPKQNIKDLQAYLVGGWDFFKKSDHALTQLLDWFKKIKLKSNIDHLYKKNGTPSDTSRIHYYDSIVFNIFEGTLCLLQSPSLILGPSFDPFAQQKADCFKYLRNNAIPLSESVEDISLPNSVGIINDNDTKKFFRHIIHSNNATPIIPALNFDHAYKQELLRFTTLAKAGNALDIIYCLYNSFVSPANAISPAYGYTPLHYACAELNNNPENYELQVIVLLILLHAHRDLKNNEGRTALSLLPNGFFKSRCEELLMFIRLQETPEGMNYKFVKKYRDITACLANSIIQHRKSPKWLQDIIHNQLADHFKKLCKTPIPDRNPINLNYVIFVLSIIFFVCKFYSTIEDSSATSCSTLTRNSKRLLM